MMKKVFSVPNKMHIQVFSYTLFPTKLVDNIDLLVRDLVNQMDRVRSSRYYDDDETLSTQTPL